MSLPMLQVALDNQTMDSAYETTRLIAEEVDIIEVGTILCVGEGVLMRRYAQGEDVTPILNALKDTLPKFYRQYYGIDPAPVLPADRIAFLDKCLHMQRTVGPTTKGSKIVPWGANQRRE